ncbi:DUF2381 family protein [Archangium gephyra]|uniref:DUF2381 family protein n=1 Tax=Archangium gephyra TaxID=48 RepID=UPI003B7F146F
MSTLPVVLAVLVFLVSAPSAAQPGSEPATSGAERQLLLPADLPGQPYEVRIGPGVSTNLFFDAPVQLVGVEAREHFRRAVAAEDSIILLPSRELLVGQRLRMTVRFMEGVAPARVKFILVVVPPALAERQVEVSRSRAPELCQQEAREAHEKARQCQAELARLRAEPKGSSGLTGLLTLELMDGQGVLALGLRLVWLEGQALAVDTATSYRATRPLKPGEEKETPRTRRVAMELWVTSGDALPWTAAGAELVSEDGARHTLSVWQGTPILAGAEMQRVVLEAELPEAEAQGSFSVELWEEGRTRSVTFGGVSFP